MTVEIRRMGPSDAALLNRVAADVFDGPIVSARLAAFLGAGDHLMVLAIDDGLVVGQARAIIHLHPDEEDELYIDNLGVTPSLHRQGVGRRLMDELIAWGRERGCTHAWVATERDNAPAIALYEALGAPPQAMMFFEYEFD